MALYFGVTSSTDPNHVNPTSCFRTSDIQPPFRCLFLFRKEHIRASTSGPQAKRARFLARSDMDFWATFFRSLSLLLKDMLIGCWWVWGPGKFFGGTTIFHIEQLCACQKLKVSPWILPEDPVISDAEPTGWFLPVCRSKRYSKPAWVGVPKRCPVIKVYPPKTATMKLGQILNNFRDL